ncbi:hypothetical protein [Sinanaerobacter chloroacetimidivorans]|uniref:Uncharacterized protein n=1 Tax=Sinanaerobacter chloroacetimidivorans TaxID=2818044 RepID=A0A8J7W7N2_9FIRM|nr:hypothetical protein [Sinanaerobacter chloroacetimidivorans]MBR0600380.1 hypothetical protein [Sinanaerobacter chloroacetimidivorans]
MRIYIRQANGRRYMIPAPIGLVKAAVSLGDFGISFARKYVPEEHRIYYDNIDFKELRKGFDVLKDYKGLKLIEVNAEDGTGVTIIV